MNANSSNRKSLVTLMDPSIDEASLPLQLQRWKDPHSNRERTYVATFPKDTVSTTLLEMHALPCDYGSFFVGNVVVGGGSEGGSSLHVLSAVDPLFWVLARNDTDANTTTQWQPLEQIMADDKRLGTCFAQNDQLLHVYRRMQVGDDEYYYKFCPTKALQWLSLKRERVQQVLLVQQQEEMAVQEQQSSSRNGGGGGAFCDSFHLAQDDNNKDKDELKRAEEVRNKRKHAQLEQQCHDESIQIVCAYLSASWRERFLQHLSVSETVLEDESTKKRRALSSSSSNNNKKEASNAMPCVTSAVDWNDVNNATTAAADTVDKAPKPPQPKTVGSKKLLKVNTKGMKKLSAFFTAKPKTTTTTKKKENTNNKE